MKKTFTFKGVIILLILCIIIFITIFLALQFFVFNKPISYGSSKGSNLIKKGQVLTDNYDSSSEKIFQRVVSKNSNVKIDFEILTLAGEIEIQVFSASKDLEYSKVFNESVSDHIELPAGTYTVKIITTNHEGGFTISWDEERE